VKRVLCAIDLSDVSVELLRYANAIVQRYGGCLTVLHIMPAFDGMEVQAGGWLDPVAVARPKVMEHLGQAVTAAGLTDGRIRYEAESGQPATTIVHRALALHADTIVLGTHVTGGLGRLLMGSVTDSVARHAPCDVLTVPPGVSFAAVDGRALTIVCGVDFSTPSIHALRAALGLAERMDARIVLVHAVEWLAEVEAPDHIDFDVADLRARLLCNGQRRLDAVVAAESPLDHTIVTKAVIGRSHRELLAIAAEERADLMILGSDGRGGTLLPMLGSTVEQIVRASPCPVLTVRLPHERLSNAHDT